MWVADVVLRRAAQLIPVQLSTIALPIDLEAIDVAAARVTNLANLDLLESVGRGRDLRGGFWRDLMRACEMLGLDDRMPFLTAEYRAALQRVGASARLLPDPDMMSVAGAVCRLPVLFRSTGDRSMVDLLAISGYTPGLTPLTRDVLMVVLRVEPTLVDAWLTHSVDKRTPSGWYFSSENTSSVVGFHPDGPRFTFADPIEACAEFILREVDGLAESMSHRAGAG
jgi:hypothetical protein